MIEFLLLNVIAVRIVFKYGSSNNAEPYWKKLRIGIFLVTHQAQIQGFVVFWGQICDDSIKGFLVVDFLFRPGQQVAEPDFPVLIEEDVLRTDITDQVVRML